MTAPDLTARDVVLAKYTKEDPIFSPRGERISSRLYVDTHAMADALVTAERERDHHLRALAALLHDYGVLQRERMTYAQQLGAVIVERDAAVAALQVPGVWSPDEITAMAQAFDKAQLAHGFYETMMAVGAALLRERVKLLTPPTEARTDG